MLVISAARLGAASQHLSECRDVIIECLQWNRVSSPCSATTLTSREGLGVDSGMRVRGWVEIPSNNIIDIPSGVYVDRVAPMDTYPT